MGKINILDKHISELIAAGEVVERPASVVKELVENSIDAGSTSITVEIIRGGCELIRITDNGTGILNDDVKNAFIRSATSKITTAEDLDSIFTLGFRGEALASVCAVSKVTLITRTFNDLEGVTIYAVGGEISEPVSAGCPVGTTICVRDLFFNTPARMKFLKKDVSEANAVASVVEKIALSHPEISFKFIREGRDELFTPGDNLLISAIRSVYNKDFAQSLMEIEHISQGVKVKGFISKPNEAKSNRTFQNFFINGRFIKSKTCMAALEQAYKNVIMVGKFPACILHIELDPARIDVNVHPAKIEVRFSDEKLIFETIYHAVRSAIENFKQRPEVILKNDINTNLFSNKIEINKPLEIFNDKPLLNLAQNYCVKKEIEITPPVDNYTKDTLDKIKSEYISSFNSDKTYKNIDIIRDFDEEMTKEKAEVIEEKAKDFKIIGELFSVYILIEADNEFYFIDKHAAREREIFNALKDQNKELERQVLIRAELVSLSIEDYEVILENIALLNDNGFDISDFGDKTISVREIPSVISMSDISGVIEEIAHSLRKNMNDIKAGLLDSLYNSIACKAAVRAGDKSNSEELEKITKKVFSDNSLMFCPHGRPVAVKLKRRDIEKYFGRI